MGQIFLQQVIPPWLVYCPKAVSRKNKGIPHVNRNRMYGMKKTPARKRESLLSAPIEKSETFKKKKKSPITVQD